MLENIIRTTKKRKAKNCNVIYVPGKGNTELLVKGLDTIFNTVFCHQYEQYTWNLSYDKGSVFTIPINYINMPIDYILYDDVLLGFNEVQKLGYYFQAPVIYMGLVDEKDISPMVGYNKLTISDSDLESVGTRLAHYSKMGIVDGYTFGLDLEENPFHDKKVVMIDNYCDNHVVQKISESIGEDYLLMLTDRKEEVRLQSADVFIHTWNYPTVKLLSYLKAGTPVLFFPSPSNLNILEDNKNGKVIQNIDTLKGEIDYLLDNKNHKRITENNKLAFSDCTKQKFKDLIEDRVYYNIEFFKG